MTGFLISSWSFPLFCLMTPPICHLSFSWFQGGKFDVCFKYTRKNYSNKYNYTKIVKNNLNDIWYITRVALKTLLVLSRLISQKKLPFSTPSSLEEMTYSFKHGKCKKHEHVKCMKHVKKHCELPPYAFLILCDTFRISWWVRLVFTD